ncbi:MAG TPA: phage tail sheath subtilisin-like domain-containing protein [Solirubrobacteraceae bacterium]|nr:phage tail sheath subtilisin-like domain-containing protein [Solirubrobacteraceae bacterium]
MERDAATPGPTAIGALPLAERRIDALPSATAGFVGLAAGGPVEETVRVDSFEAFAAAFADPARPRRGPFEDGAKLGHAVRGYFRNGGHACWVVRSPGLPGEAPVAGLLAGLRLLAALDEPTAIAVPDAHGLAGGARSANVVQRELVGTCARVVGRIALVDPPPGLDPAGALAWREQSRIDSAAAAAYYPWIEVSDPASGRTTAAPPCGHAAGIWARVDARAGPHRAPTAEALIAADGPVVGLEAGEQHRLNRAGVNCLRAWPGPELRVWGARTLSADPELRYLHRQRIVGHLVASIAQGTRWAIDEPAGDPRRARLVATVTAFLTGWWRAGALLGDSPSQAFYVRCDSTPEGGETGDPGDLVFEVGLAIRRAGDFRVLRIAHHANAPAVPS